MSEVGTLRTSEDIRVESAMRIIGDIASTQFSLIRPILATPSIRCPWNDTTIRGQAARGIGFLYNAQGVEPRAEPPADSARLLLVAGVGFEPTTFRL